MTNGKVKGKAGELRKMRRESGTGQPESGTESGTVGTESGTGWVLGRNDMSMKHDHYEILRRMICGEHDTDSCDGCPLYDMDNCYEQTPEAEMAMLALFGRRPAKDGEAEKAECRSDVAESPVTPFEYKTGISYSTGKRKPLRSDSSAKSAKPYPQDVEEDEYRYIDADWLEAVARGLTAGADKHPGETWRQIPPEEHAARAMRHLNLYRAGDRNDTHLVNAAMRCMMAYATERARREERA